VSSLRGAYVTAEDAGTTPADMAEVHRRTRFATCVPPEIGGSGNPSAMTAEGVVVAMEAALAFRGTPGLAGRRVAMQGAGNVGAAMIELLLARGVSRVVVAESSAEQRDLVLDRFAAEPITVRLAAPGDASILAEPCDVLAPNALGGVLDAKTIPEIRASIVCGGANNPLADDSADAKRLVARGITYVPDFIANRLGIVFCANEHAGTLPDDPAVKRHLDPRWPDSIPNVTQHVLAEAARTGDTPIAVANRLADARIEEPHPIWGRRAEEITNALLQSGWVDG
jgi:glutamate dehydrogenase/leucine dehydrogenase